MQAEKQIANAPSVTRQNLQFILGVVLIALILFAYYTYTWRNGFNFRTAIDTCSKPFCDFATYYYPMGDSIFQTREPVEGFVYSPFIALVFALFTPLGLGSSLLLWGILQGVFILLYLNLFRRLVPTGQRIQLLFVSLALSTFPLLHNLAWGQVGVITTVSILGALFFCERDQRALAAVLLAFGISFKFFPIIFLLPFVLRRDFRFLLYFFAACGMFLFVIPASLLGMDGVTRFYAALFDSYRHFDWVLSSYNSQHFPHVMLRLVKAAGLDHELLRLAGAAGYNVSAYLLILGGISYSIATLNAVLVFLIQRSRLPNANLWSFHILFLSIPFILPTSWPVDLVYLPFGQALLAWKILEGDKTLSWRHPLPERKVASLLILTSIAISNIVFFNFIGDSILYGSFGFIFWADLLLLLVSYMKLLPSALRRFTRNSAAAGWQVRKNEMPKPFETDNRTRSLIGLKTNAGIAKGIVWASALALRSARHLSRSMK
jgi:hypothetical protein